MRYLKALFLLAVAAGVYGQSASTIHGIKVVSSAFDSTTHKVNLAFVNDTPLNITAWGYCVHAQNAPGHNVSHGYCTWVDPLVTVVEHKIESSKRPKLPEPDCPSCRVIHPGETMTLTGDFSQTPDVVEAMIEINLIVYSDGSIESLKSVAAQTALQTITTGRTGSLAIKRELLEIATKILGDPSDTHPATTMIHNLELRAPSEPGLADLLDGFKRPGWHQADQREYVPADEKGYLKQYVAELQVWIAEYSKNQIKGGGQ